MTTHSSEEKEDSAGTGEAPLDRLEGEPPDEASDDPAVAICPDGQVTSGPQHGEKKRIEQLHRMHILG